jgi:hypothetical protein
MLKLTVWMNIPSHYQRAFFRALNARASLDVGRRVADVPYPWPFQALICEGEHTGFGEKRTP